MDERFYIFGMGDSLALKDSFSVHLIDLNLCCSLLVAIIVNSAYRVLLPARDFLCSRILVAQPLYSVELVSFFKRLEICTEEMVKRHWFVRYADLARLLA